MRGKVVGDPGIEPGMGLPGGVTVRCRTLQLVARVCGRASERVGVITSVGGGRQQENSLQLSAARRITARNAKHGDQHDEKAQMGRRKRAGKEGVRL